MKKNCFRLVAILIVCYAGFLCWDNRESRFKEQIRDLQLQLAESRQKVDTFFIHDSIPVWKERVVEVDKTDYKRQLADKQLIKELGLKVSQVEAENRMLIGARDTVYFERGRDSVLRYHDQWADFSYFEYKDMLEYCVRDSLTTIVSREYRHRFLWWKWGTKGYNVHIVNHNPNAKVYYNKYIRVKEK